MSGKPFRQNLNLSVTKFHACATVIYAPHFENASSTLFAEEGQRLGSVHESTPRPREKVKRRNTQNHHFPMKKLHFWKTTRRPRVDKCLMWPQPGVVSFTTESDATDSDFPSGDPHAGPLGSADSEGPRPHAPTLEKRPQPNVSFGSSLKVIEINGFRAFC